MRRLQLSRSECIAGGIAVSTDELSGVQALERKHSGLPMRPGKVERREYEYIRHSTQTFIVNLDVATGQIGTTSYGSTRNEEDFVNHVKRTVEADPSVTRWHFVTAISTFINRSLW